MSDDREFVPGQFPKTISYGVAESFRWASANALIMQVLVFYVITVTVSVHVPLVGPRDPGDSVLSLSVCTCTYTLTHAYLHILASCS